MYVFVLRREMLMNTTAIVVIAIVIVLVIMFIGFYNKFVNLRNRVDNAWAQIDVQLQRRLDLIPNLVETVKGYAAHEAGTLQAVTAARQNAASAGTVEEKMEANNQLTSTLRTLFAVAEAYPDLKANQNFLSLQNQLAETEDKISYMRQSYNDTVMIYNTGIQTFPGVLFAALFKFDQRPLYKADSSAEAAPKVSFAADGRNVPPVS